MATRTTMLILAMLLFLPPVLADVEVQSDPSVDFSTYSTYAWSKGLPAARPKVQEEIVKVVDQQLAAKGLKPDDEAPELWVVTYTFGMDETGTSGGFYRNPNWGWGVITTDARMVARGTLIIDLVDVHDKKVVWQAVAKDNVTDVDEALKKIQVVVPKMFRKYPRR